MTPEQLALLQAGAEEVYDPTLRARVMAGELPPEALNPRGATYRGPSGPQPPSPGIGQQVSELGAKGKEFAKRGAAGAQEFLGKYGKYAPAAVGVASIIPGVTTALSEINEGRPTGALGALAPTALSALGTGLAMIPNPVTRVAGYGLMGLGALLPGAAASGAESVRQKATGEPTKGKEGEFSTQMAINKQLAELGTTQYRDNMGVYTSMIRDLNRDASNQAHLDLQRNIPLINQLKNAELVRSQALINTQNQAYMQQGVVATAGALATGAQQQTGATVRQALGGSPYNIALQSPAISFG
jgi:hypothetical protein